MDLEPSCDDNMEEEFEEALLRKSSSKGCPEMAINDRDLKTDEAAFGMTRRRTESGSDEAFSSKESKRIKMEQLPDDANEALLKKNSRSKDCRKMLISDTNLKKDEASFVMTMRSESGSDEAFSSKESKRIKMEPLSDDINIKTETNEYHDELLNNSFDILPTKCDNGMDEPSISGVCITSNNSSNKLHERNHIPIGHSHQKSKNKLARENFQTSQPVKTDQPRTSKRKNTARQAEYIYMPTKRSQLNNHVSFHSSKLNSFDESYPRSNDHANMKLTLEKLLSCQLCSYQTNRKDNLKQHDLTHTGEQPFSCEICSYATRQKEHLKRNILIHTGEMPFSCEICSYQTNLKASLKRHLLSHTGEKPFSCEICSYATAERGNLSKHILTHTGEKPFSCEICSYATAHKGNLKQHNLTHTGEKPFSCEICSYKSRQKGRLMEHIFTHTGEKPFSCEICSYATAHKGNLKQHILTHAKENPLSCEICSFRTSQKSCLSEHILIHTEQKPVSSEL